MNRMLRRIVIAGTLVVAAIAVTRAPVVAQPPEDKAETKAKAELELEPHAKLIERQIAYLQYLGRARWKLTKGDLDGVVSELEHALALDVPDTTLENIDLQTSHAAAHYEMARVRTIENKKKEAKRHLREAAENGFRDTAFVKTDPFLATLAPPAEFAKLVAMFPAENPTDSFAGKTVADPRFGMSLLDARKGNFPKLGERAPDFELPRLTRRTKPTTSRTDSSKGAATKGAPKSEGASTDAKNADTESTDTGNAETLRLSSLIGDKPIVLVFGSFT